MDTAKTTLIIAVLLSLITAAAHPAANPANQTMNASEYLPPETTKPEPTPDTHSASCLVKVTANPVILPLNIGTIDYLLNSSAVAGKAAREILGIK